MSRILFGTIACSLLLAISYATVKIYALGFRWNAVYTRTVFLIFLLIPILFVSSLIFSRVSAIAPFIYTTIQIIAGIGLYLFLGALILGVILLGFFLGGKNPSVGIAITVLTLSLLAAIIGLIESRIFRIVDYTVALTNAPDSWEGKTAVLVTDTHFGLVNYTRFSEKVVDTILGLGPDFVLHAGDFYDGPSIATPPITASWKRLADALPVFYTPGNHEEYGAYAAFITSIKDAGITVLADTKGIFDGVQIAGITYREGKDNPEAATAIKRLELDPAKPTILLNHPPTSLRAAQTEGVQLQVSGHTHNGQFWPMTYIVRRVYGVYYHGLKNFETMHVITSSGIGTFGPPFRLFNRPELVRIHFTRI